MRLSGPRHSCVGVRDPRLLSATPDFTDRREVGGHPRAGQEMRGEKRFLQDLGHERELTALVRECGGEPECVFKRGIESAVRHAAALPPREQLHVGFEDPARRSLFLLGRVYRGGPRAAFRASSRASSLALFGPSRPLKDSHARSRRARRRHARRKSLSLRRTKSTRLRFRRLARKSSESSGETRKK